MLSERERERVVVEAEVAMLVGKYRRRGLKGHSNVLLRQHSDGPPIAPKWKRFAMIVDCMCESLCLSLTVLPFINLLL